MPTEPEDCDCPGGVNIVSAPPEVEVEVQDTAPVSAESWNTTWKIAKFHGDDTTVEPFEVVYGRGNIIVTTGKTAVLQALSGVVVTYYSAANARIGVGNSTTAAAVAQTDLQAATSKLRKAMDASFPQVSGTSLVFRATFASGEATYAWNEWAVFNAGAGGTMLNRKVETMGTKPAGESWQITVTITM